MTQDEILSCVFVHDDIGTISVNRLVSTDLEETIAAMLSYGYRFVASGSRDEALDAVLDFLALGYSEE